MVPASSYNERSHVAPFHGDFPPRRLRAQGHSGMCYILAHVVTDGA